MTGVGSIRLLVEVNGKEVRFLVDTGAKHNFIDPFTVRRLNLPIENMKKFKIKIAGGEKFEESIVAETSKILSKGWTLFHWLIHK